MFIVWDTQWWVASGVTCPEHWLLVEILILNLAEAAYYTAVSILDIACITTAAHAAYF